MLIVDSSISDESRIRTCKTVYNYKNLIKFILEMLK